MNRAVINQLVKLYKETHLGKRLPAYDGRKSLYTAGPLPFISKEFKIVLTDEDDGSGTARYSSGLLLLLKIFCELKTAVNSLLSSHECRRKGECKVVITLASRADLHHLEMFLKGRQADAPQEALQVLDIVLSELPTSR